jgi:hypothetical protein
MLTIVHRPLRLWLSFEQSRGQVRSLVVGRSAICGADPRREGIVKGD